MLGPAMGGNLISADLEGLRSNLAASPWVGGAVVRRKLPNALLVDVTERFPIALAETDQLYVMDASGELIDLLGPRTAGFDLPIIRGLGGCRTKSAETVLVGQTRFWRIWVISRLRSRRSRWIVPGTSWWCFEAMGRS